MARCIMNAMYATKHLVSYPTWRSICGPTRVKGHLYVRPVVKVSPSWHIFRSITWFTQERNHTNAMFARSVSAQPQTWKPTWGFTVVKSLSSANCAQPNSPSLSIWSSIRDYIQMNDHMNALSVTESILAQVDWKPTGRRVTVFLPIWTTTTTC